MSGYDWGAFYGALGIPAAQANLPPTPSAGNPRTTPVTGMGNGSNGVDMGHDASYWQNFYQETRPWYGFPKLDQGSTVPVYNWNDQNPMDLAAGDPPGVSYSNGNSVGSVAGGSVGNGSANLGGRRVHPVARVLRAVGGVFVGGNWGSRVNDPTMAPVADPARLVLTPQQRSVSTPEYIAAVNSESGGYTPAGSNAWMPTTTISGGFRQNYGDSSSSGSLASRG